MRSRKFSCREKTLIDQMIRTVCRELSLSADCAAEAQSIGWCAFLTVYQENPAAFRWSEADGWTRAYMQIAAELSAFRTQEAALA